MNSFRTRVTLLVAGVALIAVGLTAWGVATATQNSLLDTFQERGEAEEAIAGELTEYSFEIDSWQSAEDDIAELAAENNARIVLTDEVGRILVDTNPSSELPEFRGVIDPLSPFGGFDDFTSEELEGEFAHCLEAEGIEAGFDEFGFLVIGEGDSDAVDECYENALATTDADTSVEVEPAWLFVEFGVTPTIPWPLLIVIAAGILLLSGAAAAFATGVVTGPVKRLTVAAQAITSGDLTARVDDDSTGEIGELSSSFNEMATEIEREDERRRQLTSDVAHELRSPVTNIVGHIDAIEDGIIEADTQNLEIIQSEADRLYQLIEDLTQLTDADEGQLQLDREATDLVVLATRVGEARKMSGTSIEVTGEGTADVDPSRIEQVLGNLVDNAITAAGPEGHVAISVAADGSNTVIEVSDDGPGIPESLIPVMFDRFRREDQVRTPGSGGRGLGLPIARTLARVHGGDIRAANRSDGGAVFTVTLPISRPESR